MPRENGFEKDKKRASEAGKKSKRKPSIMAHVKKELLKKPTKAILEAVEKELGAKLTATETGQLLAKSMLYKAASGDTQAAKYITDQLDGKAKETIEHSGNVNLIIDQ